jgi:S-DNA-T family DNA segregation ATPase FtsK/SpoIIIE
MIVVAVRILANKPPVRSIGEGTGVVIGLASLAALSHLVGRGWRIDGVAAGGRIGEYGAEILSAAVSTAGTALVAVTGLVAALILTLGLDIRAVGRVVARGAAILWRGMKILGAEIALAIGDAVRAIFPEKDREEIDEELDEEPEFVKPGRDDAAPREALDGDTVRVGEPEMEPIIVEPRKKARKKKDPTAETAGATPAPGPDPVPLAIPPPPAPAAASPAPGAPAALAAAGGPVIVESAFHKAAKKEMKEKEKAVAENRPDYIPMGDGVYRLPSVSLLKYDDTGVSLDRDQMLELSARLVKTLADYGVRGEVQAIRPGPVVTMYEFAPAPGTRVSKIANLADDLAMALEAVSVRIVAPIPGKAAVGIEVPNKLRETVFLKEIIADDVFQKAKSKLTLALGKDIEGRPVAVDLAKMPHLLVAGTTGAGKSVAVNAMITSILYNATPEEVRMIMVDPKMLELSVYEGIPHLLLPVVTDPKKANLALRWAVEEMERRYELLADAGVRDIMSYNKKVEKKSDTVEVVVEESGEAADLELAEGSQLELPQKTRAAAPQKKLPYIVVVIDEFADLMMVAPKDVETSVARIAQKARAAGIHLILATQRPSVDVITGLIKANFPSRIAFKVIQRNDSRTILDQNGAEALLGQGDMLFSDRGGSLRRVHGCLVQDEEIHGVVDFLKKQGKPVYDLEILKPREEENEGGEVDPEDDLSDEMYDRAVALVAETRQASISMIQRRLRVGYNRAARMVERMEREGIVGPQIGPNRREVLIQPTA